MTRPKVLLTRRWPDAVERHLMERYDATLNTADILTAGDATVRIIGNYRVGINHVDVAAARRAGIVVMNTPDRCA